MPRQVVLPTIVKDKALLKVQRMANLGNKVQKATIMGIAKKLYKINSKKMIIAFNVKAFDVQEKVKFEDMSVSVFASHTIVTITREE